MIKVKVDIKVAISVIYLISFFFLMQYKGVFKVDIKVVVCVLPTRPSPHKASSHEIS